MSGHHLQQAAKFEKGRKRRRGTSQGRTTPEAPQGQTRQKWAKTVDKENEKKKRGLRLSHWAGLLSTKRKGRRHRPFPPFHPRLGNKTLNYILKVPLGLAVSRVAHTPRGAARGVYPGPESG